MINQTIVDAIKGIADREGSGYGNWYCGITADPAQRLGDHKVPSNHEWCIHRMASSEQDARDTEQQLISLGFDGGGGGGDDATVHVYAYKKIPGVTKE